LTLIIKTLNDRWGDVLGDRALRHFADLVRAQTREGDIFGRLGGEEFGVVLSGTTVEAAALVGQRIQYLTAQTPLIHGGNHTVLQVSFGRRHAGGGR